MYTSPDPMDQWFDPSLAEEGMLEFTTLPIPESSLVKVYPLGLMGSHTFPTDHIYLEYAHTKDPQTGLGEDVPVYAPAAGRILYIEYAGPPYNDNSVHISISRDITYVLGHLIMDPGLAVGHVVEAGDSLGICVNGSNLDLLVLDKRNGKNSCDNDKYPFTTSYACNPFSYFPSDLREMLYSRIIPHVPAKDLGDLTMDHPSEHDSSLDGEHVLTYLASMETEIDIYDRLPDGRSEAFASHYKGLDEAFKAVDGNFEHDIPARLQGNWFSSGDDGLWHEGIAFAYDAWFPAQARISYAEAFGPGTNTNGRHAVRSDQPGYVPFDEVNAGDTTTYTLYSPDTINWHGVPYGQPTGLLKVEMMGDTTIKVEVFTDTTVLNPDFTASARIYYR